MSLTDSQEGEDRLRRFRRWMSQLDPAGDPARAFSAGLYLASPGAVSKRIAARLEIAPASTHLLIGGVGSGKSTELLEVQRRLHAHTPDTNVLFLDVSKGHDISKVAPGVIIVQIALACAGHLTKPDEEQEHAIQRLHHLADGYDAHPADDFYDGSYHVPGLLQPPDRFTEDVIEASNSLSVILADERHRQESLVVLIDGLDRMTNMSAFESIVLNDVAALTKDAIGVVLAGPLKSLYGIDHVITQRFDGFHYQSWIDPASAPGNSSFLTQVLRRRLPEDALGESELNKLAIHSGGVLRDLIALAQFACLEAYMGESDTIGSEQTLSAIDAFGRNHMQGLRKADIEVLQRVRTKGSFVQTSEDDLALLMTRRVLEYRGDGRPRYVVHPTIEPFLRELATDNP